MEITSINFGYFFHEKDGRYSHLDAFTGANNLLLKAVIFSANQSVLHSTSLYFAL